MLTSARNEQLSGTSAEPNGTPLAPLLPAFGLRTEGNEGRLPATLAMGVGMKRLLTLIRETTGAEEAEEAEEAEGQEPQESGEEG